MEIQIRQAELDDLDLLVQWRMEVLHEVFPAKDYKFPAGLEEENRSYYKRSLSDGTHIACFAIINGKIEGCGGMCLYQEMPSPDNPNGNCAYIMNIYCRPAFRNHQVGETVVRWLIGQAKDRQITKIYLETSESGRKLYEKIGFKDMEDMLILPG